MKVEFVCNACDAVFEAEKYGRAGSPRKFCSRACAGVAKKKHGLSGGSPTYSTWANMVGRCTRPYHAGYAGYGARGITICERWLTFANFLEDMGERPAGTSIDRIDGDGNYEPGNCRWATRHEQQQNLSTNANYTFNGKTQCISEWSRELGIHCATLRYRLVRGWGDRAFVIPPTRSNRIAPN